MKVSLCLCVNETQLLIYFQGREHFHENYVISRSAFQRLIQIFIRISSVLIVEKPFYVEQPNIHVHLWYSIEDDFYFDFVYIKTVIFLTLDFPC